MKIWFKQEPKNEQWEGAFKSDLIHKNQLTGKNCKLCVWHTLHVHSSHREHDPHAAFLWGFFFFTVCFLTFHSNEIGLIDLHERMCVQWSNTSTKGVAQGVSPGSTCMPGCLLSCRGASMTVGLCAGGLGLVTAPTGHSQTKEFLSRLSVLPQVGVCDEERLPGEGGGHPVVSHHQVKRCHVDQQLWDWPSPVEPWGLCYTSKCEPAQLSLSGCLAGLLAGLLAGSIVSAAWHPSPQIGQYRMSLGSNSFNLLLLCWTFSISFCFVGRASVFHCDQLHWDPESKTDFLCRGETGDLVCLLVTLSSGMALFCPFFCCWT